MTFKYKAVERPRDDGFYYFVVKTPAGGNANNLAFTKWSDAAGAGGTKTISFRLGDFDDYFLIWGIHNRGALSIDDIKVTKRKKIFEGNEDFESGKFNDTLFTYERMATRGWIVSDPERVVSGKFSAYGEGNPSKDEWSSFLRSDHEKLALERNGLYTLTFKYKAVKAPSADGYYYFVVWTNAGGAGNKKGLTKWSDAAGTVGTKTIDFTLGDYDDYCLIWGIHREGALAIDDIKVKKRN